MKIIPLGTNGFFPSFGRQTACYAVPFKETLIILDAGSGLFRLAEPEGQKLLKDANEVHIFLSHHHLDHTFGFYGAWKILEWKKVTVYNSFSSKTFSDLSQDYFPVDFKKEHKNFSWKVIQEGSNDIVDYQVTVRWQNHGLNGCLAFRFNFPVGRSSDEGGGLVYITDSEPTKESVDFVKNIPLLLHEHWETGEKIIGKKLEDHFIGKHVTTIGASLIAKEANVGKLVLIHHSPFNNDQMLNEQLKKARSVFPESYLAKDLEAITF